MTREDIERLVAAWVPRLGLRHWGITVDWSTPADDTADAQIESPDSYDRATLYFHPEFHKWDADRAERIVVHELVHLITRDLEATAEATHPLLEGAARTLAAARFGHELEGVVDRVAVVLVAIARQSLTERLQCS